MGSPDSQGLLTETHRYSNARELEKRRPGEIPSAVAAIREVRAVPRCEASRATLATSLVAPVCGRRSSALDSGQTEKSTAAHGRHGLDSLGFDRGRFL